MANKQGLVFTLPCSRYCATKRLVQDAERRLAQSGSPEALALLRTAEASLESARTKTRRSQKSSLYLSARMAVGLALRETTRQVQPEPEAA